MRGGLIYDMREHAWTGIKNPRNTHNVLLVRQKSYTLPFPSLYKRNVWTFPLLFYECCHFMSWVWPMNRPFLYRDRDTSLVCSTWGVNSQYFAVPMLKNGIWKYALTRSHINYIKHTIFLIFFLKTLQIRTCSLFFHGWNQIDTIIPVDQHSL